MISVRVSSVEKALALPQPGYGTLTLADLCQIAFAGVEVLFAARERIEDEPATWDILSMALRELLAISEYTVDLRCIGPEESEVDSAPQLSPMLDSNY